MLIIINKIIHFTNNYQNIYKDYWNIVYKIQLIEGFQCLEKVLN
jgi:hypothetical protein